MAYIFSAIQYIMDLGAAMFLPIMITILGLVFGLKFFESLRKENAFAVMTVIL